MNMIIPQLTLILWYYHDMEMFFANTGPMWGESNGDQWIPLTKDQLCRALMFLCFWLEQPIWQTNELMVNWKVMTFTWRYCNVCYSHGGHFLHLGTDVLFTSSNHRRSRTSRRRLPGESNEQILQSTWNGDGHQFWAVSRGTTQWINAPLKRLRILYIKCDTNHRPSSLKSNPANVKFDENSNLL